MLILIDSGSSHSFVSASFLQNCDIQPTTMVPQRVKVANGDELLSDQQVRNLEWWIQGHTFHTVMKVLDLGPFDAILGYDWLEPRSPMVCHWGNKTLAFEEQGQQILLQGVLSRSLSIEEISSTRLVKSIAGNDISAFVILEVTETGTTSSTSSKHLR
jgi:hypothetical protein